ncbi:MAG TPA: hypothetical protein VGI93_24130 [Steroidobacteraceae bacterium]|jgi:hypothetical protein
MPTSSYSVIKALAAGMFLVAGTAAGKGLDLAPYRISSVDEEIALARTAAPPSISADAEVLALTDQGYKSVHAGKNGFVCVVERSWGTPFDDPQFFNPKIRSPICFNSAGAKSALAAYVERTRDVLAGYPTAELIHRAEARGAKSDMIPGPGAMCYMLSKLGYLSDDGGHWHPHLMFFVASDAKSWGANLPGSPVIAATDKTDPTTTFMVTVGRWSDGTRDEAVHE